MKNNKRFGQAAYVHYKGGIKGEEPIDDRSIGDPVKIILGAGAVIPAIEDALSEMEVGEERTMTIAPEDAYGRHDEDGVQVYPRSMFSFGDELEVGSVFQWTNPTSGMPIPVRVVEASPDLVKVDFNHPFADKTLEYWIRLEELRG